MSERAERPERSERSRKKKYSFNVFDFFVILLVLILIATVVYKISVGSAKEANKDNPVYTVVFECRSEPSSLDRYLKDGEEVYIKSSGELLGYIYRSADSNSLYALTPIESTTGGESGSESATESVSASGEKVYSNTGFKGLIKLNGNAEKSKEGTYYSIEGLNITVGSSIDVYTSYAEFTITVMEFTDKNTK